MFRKLDPRKNPRKEERQGTVLVEFALVAPIFFLVVLASFEFGWLNVIRHTADNAAYEAARCIIVPGGTAAEAIATANNFLSTVGARNTSVTVTPSVIKDETEFVTVRVEVPMNSNGLLAPRFTKNTKMISSCTLKTERAN